MIQTLRFWEALMFDHWPPLFVCPKMVRGLKPCMDHTRSVGFVRFVTMFIRFLLVYPSCGSIYWSQVHGHVDLRKQMGFSRRYRCFYWDAALTPDETARDRESGWQLGWKVALRSGSGCCKEFFFAKENHKIKEPWCMYVTSESAENIVTISVSSPSCFPVLSCCAFIIVSYRACGEMRGYRNRSDATQPVINYNVYSM